MVVNDFDREPSEWKPSKNFTNADHIRSMSDEALAVYIALDHWDCHKCPEHERLSDNPLMRGKKCDEDCARHCMNWLKQPYKEKE